MSEQDPIPPRRHARRHSPGEDDEPPPWANLPPVRPARPGAPSRPANPARRPDGPPRPDGPARYGRPDGFGGRPDGPAGRPDVPAGRPTPPGGMPAGPGAQPGGSGYPGQAGYPGQQGYPGQPGYPGPSGQPYSGPTGRGFPPANYGPPGNTDPGSLFNPVRPGSSDPGQQLGSYGPAGYVDSEDVANDAQWANPPEGGHDYDESARGERALQRLLRKRRRRTWVAIGAVIVLVAAVGGYFATRGTGNTAVISGDLVTTFQKGELQQVPNACEVVSSGIVSQYLPGTVKVAAPQAIDGKLGSACYWTVDKAPTYRLLELNLLAYAPSGLAAGDGSATENAIGNYAQQLQNMQSPSKKSYAPKATVTILSSLGNQAFSSIQVFHPSGATTDVASVVIRYHNVVVQATMNAPGAVEHTKKGVYQPADVSQLEAAALAFAQAAEAALTTS